MALKQIMPMSFLLHRTLIYQGYQLERNRKSRQDQLFFRFLHDSFLNKLFQTEYRFQDSCGIFRFQEYKKQGQKVVNQFLKSSFCLKKSVPLRNL